MARKPDWPIVQARQLTSAKNKGFRLKPGSFERIFNAENDGTGGLVKLIGPKELSIKVSDKKQNFFIQKRHIELESNFLH